MTSNVVRKGMTAREIRRDAAEYMRLTGCTQKEAAGRLGIDPTILSRVFATRRIPADLQAACDTLAPSVLLLIGPLPTQEAMRQVVKFATTETNGRRPTREAVQRYIKAMKGGQKRGRKPRAFSVVTGKRKITLQTLENDSSFDLINDLKELIDRLRKLPDVPPEAWGVVL